MKSSRRQALSQGLITALSCSPLGGLVACGGGDGAASAAGASGDQDAAPRVSAQALVVGPGYANVRVAPFNAKGDGIADDTAALQAAVDASTRVHLPAGNYSVTSLRLRSELNLVGDEGLTVLTQRGNASLLRAESAGPGQTLDNISIQGLRLEGQVAARGFAEHTHLIDARGVKNLKVQLCTLRGFRGDGIYLGGASPGDGSERHNTNVLILENEFDGVNADNRNGVTIVDGNGVVVQRNHFHDCTRPDMPGAIDIEPNAQAFHVVRNIIVSSNRLREVGGNVAAIAVVLAGRAYKTAPSNFLIAGNRIDNCAAFGLAFVNSPAGGVDGGTRGHDLAISGNAVRGARRGFGVTGVAGALIEGNQFTDSEGSMVGYVEPAWRSLDVTVRGNQFLSCGSKNGIGLSVHSVRGLAIQGNRFDDCGTGGPGSYALDFRSGSSKEVSLLGNVFAAPTGKTRIAVQREANHETEPATNRFEGNVLNGLPHRFEST